MNTRTSHHVGYTATVEVEISSYELKAAGYHHDDDCKQVHADAEFVDAALEAFHDELHGRNIPLRMCTTEPCRSLFMLPQARTA